MHLNSRGLPLADDVSVESVAAATTGFTGADLANLVNEAALLAGRANHSKVTQIEFDAAILRAVVGIEKKRSLVKGVEKDVVSKHEVGPAGCFLFNWQLSFWPNAHQIPSLSFLLRYFQSNIKAILQA